MIRRYTQLVVVGWVALCAMAASDTKSVTVKGSDTMVILSQRWAENFMKLNPGVSVQVTGGGSGTGFAALINGTTGICNASRPIKAKEVDQIKQKFGSEPIEIKSAIDGIALFVEESNPLNEVTLAQLKSIFTGAITNWKDLGGPDKKIIMYGRENSSGTYEFFREHVLGNIDYSPYVQGMPGTAAVVSAVSKDKYGIGYGGTAYGKGVKFLKVKASDTTVACEPTADNIKAAKYPISRYLYMYTLKQPEGAIKQFIDFALSAEGQKIVTDVGYFPL